MLINLIEELKKQGFILNNRNISPPKPIVITEAIPFRDGSFDFSFVNSGRYNYQNRTIDLQYTLYSEGLGNIYSIYGNTQNLLLSNPHVKIQFDDIEGHYLGTIRSFSDLDDFNYVGKFNVGIEIQPFKQLGAYGNDIWDEFNFETDATEHEVIEIVDSIVINIANTGLNVIPKINCSSDMTIIKDDITYSFKAGDNINKDFILKNGDNNVNITGTGTIKFIFRKESF